MPIASTAEIQFHNSEMVIFPSLKVINGRKSAGKICSEVGEALTHREEEPVTEVVVDLELVKWISSAGLNELIRLQGETRASGVGLRFRSLSDAVREVFRITRLERTFELDEMNGADPAGERADSSDLQDHPTESSVTA